MAKWLRSAEMEYLSITFEEDVGHQLMDELGSLGSVEFTDLSHHLTAFQRRYASYIRRCDELERKTRYFESVLKDFEIEPAEPPPIDTFLSTLCKGDGSTAGFDNLEQTINEKEKDLHQLSAIYDQLRKEYNEKAELKEILVKGHEFFEQDKAGTLSDHDENTSLIQAEEADSMMKFSFISGIIDRDEQIRLERMIFRATRGNCFMKFTSMGKLLGSKVEKVIFLIFYRTRSIQSLLIKICDAFNAKRYDVPYLPKRKEVNKTCDEIEEYFSDSKDVLDHSYDNLMSLLNEISNNLNSWKWIISKEKLIYHTLNKCETNVGGMLRAEGWVLKAEEDLVIESVRKAHANVSSQGIVERLPSKGLKPPTYFQVNYFTSIYQSITDTYGIARYGEANPSLFTLVTFPLMFGMMFGDVGHSLIITIFALGFILFEDKLKKMDLGEIFDMVFGGRYIIIIMGLFGMYCGLLYNDCFSLGMDLFGTKYILPETNDSTYDAIHIKGEVYPFGIDPMWKRGTNELVYVNSLKMKLAVIVGIVHMIIGVCLKIANTIYFNNKRDLWFEAIPQIIFIVSLFGYMIFVIVLKWFIDWDVEMSKHRAVPELITTLINIALSPGSVLVPLFNGQAEIQVVLLLLAVICIPWMLLVKPTLINNEHKRKIAGLPNKGRNEHKLPSRIQYLENNPTIRLEEEEVYGPELYIHQGIEVIEYVLGCVSNTASYLRLWALSLAHSQMSLVFWQRIMVMLFGIKNFIVTFVGFFIFALLTTFFLLCMDALECYLHAVRLHWVEFQNKFYLADGYKFEPFSFKNALCPDE